MVRLQVRYETEEERQRIINTLSSGSIISKISKTYKQGKYYRIYIDVKWIMEWASMNKVIDFFNKKGNKEIIKALKDFNEVMNSTLGEVTTISSCAEVETRKTTFQDIIDFYKSEWYKTVDLLQELGIDLETEPTNIRY